MIEIYNFQVEVETTNLAVMPLNILITKLKYSRTPTAFGNGNYFLVMQRGFIRLGVLLRSQIRFLLHFQTYHYWNHNWKLLLAEADG